jgi:hypothetical protein
MSSGSSNSNFGYGNINPFLKSGNVNAHNAHSSQFFNSNEISGGNCHGLAGAKSNIDAANSVVPGLSLQKGGRGKRTKRRCDFDFDPRFLEKYFLSSNVNSRPKKNAISFPDDSFLFQNPNLSFSRTMRSSRSRPRVPRRRPTKRNNVSHKVSRRVRRQSKRRSRSMNGGGGAGYSQYGSNIPNTPSLSVAGVHLSPQNLNQANPPPITRMMNCGK